MANWISNETQVLSNKTQEKSLSCQYELGILNGIYLREIISGLGFFLNLICMFIFFKILRSAKNSIDLYKYLLVASFFNSYICLRNTLKNSLDCKSCFVEKYYAIKLLQILFIYYVDYSFELISIMISVAACFNRYRSIGNTLKVFDKIPFVIVLILICVFCTGFCSYKIVDLSVQNQLNNNSTDLVIYVIKSNTLEELGLALDIVFTLIRDAIPIFSILSLNTLTLIKIKIRLNKKKKLMSNKKVQNNIKTVNKIANNELRLNLMVFVTTSFVLLNHLTNFLYWLKAFGKNECLNIVRNVLYWSSYGWNFFIYLSFDLNFMKIFSNNFKRN